MFDLEQLPENQEFDLGDYDVVVAANVLHATRAMRPTLRNAKALLKRNGLILINEITQSDMFAHLSFGLLEGWWLHEDSELRIEGTPLLGVESWRAVLHEEGFLDVIMPVSSEDDLGAQIIVGRSDGMLRIARTQPPPLRQSVLQEPDRVTPVATQHAAVAGGSAEGSLVVVAVSEVDLHRRLMAHVCREVALVLRMPAEGVEVLQPLSRYGIDSILAVQVADRLGADFGGVGSTLLFEHQSISALASHFLSTQRDRVVALVGTGGAPRAAFVAAAPTAAVGVAGRRLGRRGRGTAVSRGTARPDVAIVGVSGRYPLAPDVETFWRNLEAGVNCIREIPRERWDWQDYFDPAKGRGAAGTMYSKWGGFLDDIACFDALFFSISPREAQRMDPQERLFLEEAYRCIASAGYTPGGLSSERRVGVFVGAMNGTYGPVPAHWSIANRVSHLFGFRGPSLALDTACSSSLTAICLAVESIRSGRCDCALAGGVNLIVVSGAICEPVVDDDDRSGRYVPAVRGRTRTGSWMPKGWGWCCSSRWCRRWRTGMRSTA